MTFEELWREWKDDVTLDHKMGSPSPSPETIKYMMKLAYDLGRSQAG